MNLSIVITDVNGNVVKQDASNTDSTERRKLQREKEREEDIAERERLRRWVQFREGVYTTPHDTIDTDVADTYVIGAKVRIKTIAVHIGESIDVGSFGSVKPGYTLTADLEGNEQTSEDLRAKCAAELYVEANKQYSLNALKMLAAVAKRRTDTVKAHEFASKTKGTRDQLKSVLL